MVICHEILPDAYLLALAPDHSATAETELTLHLAHACRSGKPAVVVDCRLLDTVSDTAAWLLWACQQRLHRRHARMVLCQVPTAVESFLRRTLACTGTCPRMVPTLNDAALA